jgi:hypothetical protein
MDPGAWGYIVMHLLLEQQWEKLYTQLHRIVGIRILPADWRPLVLFCSNRCTMAEVRSVHTETKY